MGQERTAKIADEATRESQEDESETSRRVGLTIPCDNLAQLKIEFKDPFTVAITIMGTDVHSVQKTFDGMGMSSQRNASRPIKAWLVFEELSRDNGFIAMSRAERQRRRKDFEKLSKCLCEFFGNPGPFLRFNEDPEGKDGLQTVFSLIGR